VHKLLGIPVFMVAVVLLGGACSSGGGARDVGSAPASTSAATTSSTSVAVRRPLAPCPSRLPSSVDNPGVPGLDAKLVPIVATAARVCRYAALNGKQPSALVRSGLVTAAAAVGQLEKQTNALHHIPNAESIPCPLNPTAPGWALEFGNGTSAVEVVVSPSDCGFATNGVISAGPSTQWVDTLATITRPV
jgi:hypothetical protein